MTARKHCQCSGCGAVVRVTADGRMFKHKRVVSTGVHPRGSGLAHKWAPCLESGKPAPTEGEQEAGR